MCRECDNYSFEWTEKDEREIEMASAKYNETIRRSVELMTESVSIIENVISNIDTISEEIKEI